MFFYDYNMSLNRNSFFENLNITFNFTNPTNSLSIIFEKFNSSFYYRAFYSSNGINNITLIFNWTQFNKELINLIRETTSREPFIYFYDLNNSLVNKPNTTIFDDYYSFKIISKVYYPFNKNAIYLSIEKENYYLQPYPQLFVISNRSKDTYNLTWFGDFSQWIMKLINNESKNLTLNINLNLILPLTNVTLLNLSLELPNNTEFLLFNYSEIKESFLKDLKEGSFKVTSSIYLNYSNFSLPLIRFNDLLFFDLIYPQVINFTVYAIKIKKVNNESNTTKVFYTLEEFNKLNNTYYANKDSFVKILLYEKHFDDYFSVDLAINNDTAVIYSINQSNATTYLIGFPINSSVLNYGLNKIKIILKDTFGNSINMSFDLVYDNVTPTPILYPNSAIYYNMLAFFVTNQDDYPYKIIAKNLINNVSKEIFYLNNTSILFTLPCVSLTNSINISVFDRALNNNSLINDFNCYLDFNKFNVSSDVQIYYLGILNNSDYFIKLNKTSVNSYIKGNYLYINNTYKLRVYGNIDFLILGIEEPINESFKVYNLVSPNFNLLDRVDKENFILYKNTTLVVSTFFFRNLRDNTYYFYSIHRKKLFDFDLLTNKNLIYYKNIPIKLNLLGNLSTITVENLNNSFISEYYENLLVPCIDGLNIIKIRAEGYNSFIEKDYNFYCNNSLVLTDNNFVEYATLEKNNNALIIINDSYVPDLTNSTHLIKKLLINFTNNNISLMLKIPWSNEFLISKITLQKDTNNLTINDFYFEGGYLYLFLNLTQDPILVIEGIKQMNNQDQNTSSQTNQNNNEETTNNDVNNDNTYSTSQTSSTSSGTSYDYSYSDSNVEESVNDFVEEVIINSKSIFIKIKVNESPKIFEFNNTFIEKLTLYAKINDTILVNITIEEKNETILGRKAIYLLKVNQLENTTILMKLNKSFDYLIKKNGNFELLNKYLISLKESDVLLVVNKEKQAIPMNKTETNQTQEIKKEKNNKNLNNNENLDTQQNIQENLEETKKEGSKKNSLFKKILIFLGLGVIIFLIIDFIDFLIKRKKGLI